MSGLSAPRILFGVHSITPYSRVDKTPYGILKVVGSANISMSAAVEELYGGANRFSWAAEAKTFKAEVACKVKAYPGFLFTQFLGGTSTDNAGEATGGMTSLSNFKGISVMSETTGISATLVKTSAKNGDIKFAKYLVLCVSSTTVDVYMYSDVDAPRGGADALTYQSDLLKITATALTITASTGTVIPNTGITLTGGSGSIGMTTGDTAIFDTRPENSKSSDIYIGAQATAMPAFGAIFVAQKRATGEMFEIEAFNAIASGFPMNLDEFAFSQTELKITCLYDPVQDAVYKLRYVSPLTFT